MQVCPTCGERFRGKERFCPLDGARLVDEAEMNRATDGEKPEALLGTLLAERYRIEEVLGVGGMGVVYRARHEALQREVAVKLLHRVLSRELGSTQRFLVEARAASQLDHENIISIYDFGRDARRRYYLVMEYAEGEALHDLVCREAPLPQERVIPMLRQILSALAAAHEEGIVHRDLKPENIICTERRGQRDFLKILDFGLAKILGEDVIGAPITSPGIIMGTPEFMSPEQARGDPVDSRSDIYSAGILAYEMLTGNVPFVGTHMQIIWDHCETPPQPPSKARDDIEIHPDLELLVLTLLAKKPEERFQNAAAALAVLDTVTRTLAQEELKSKSVIERTRAELKKSSVIAPARRSDRPLSETVQLSPEEAGAAVEEEAEPTVQTVRPDSVWHRSVLLEELNRLSDLRAQRIREVADLLWGVDQAPKEVRRRAEAIQKVETVVSHKKAEVAMLRGRVEAHAVEAREKQAALRRQRVDLVARAAAVNHALARAEGAEVTADMPSSEYELHGSEAAATFEIPESSTVTDLRAEHARLDDAIAETDRETATLEEVLSREVTAYERAIRIKLGDVERLKSSVASAAGDLEAIVRRAAAERPDLAEHLAALDELNEAIETLRVTLARARAVAEEDEEAEGS